MKFRVNKEADRDAVKAYLDRIKFGTFEYDVEVKRHKQELTDPQRNLYWLWIGVIASETGNDRDMIHKVLKAKFLGWDETEVLGRVIKREKSIKPLGKDEMSAYMTQVDAYMLNDFGIVLPHPEDLYYNSFERDEQ
ncbi:MAG: hypothetical protein J6U51_06890 [Bacteroidales bacterium]|nr:hypothetical protein [Bacteroidales bacterium]